MGKLAQNNELAQNNGNQDFRMCKVVSAGSRG